MQLIRLSLENFRQHADTELLFRSGLTGIIGPNGSGKSTILEAIAWAIYGVSAIRGTKDTLRFNRAAGRARVRAELDFELRGERYRVLRTPNKAELYRLEKGDLIASGINEVTRQLTRRLGMTRDEFFNTYFTKQKDLQFLATMKPNERALFLSQVLGYERLRIARDLVREERKVLRGQVDELSRSLGDPDEIKQARKEAEARLKKAGVDAGAAEQAQAQAAARLAELEPAWSTLQAARERDRQLNEELRVARTRLDQALQRKREAELELEGLAHAARRLDELREQVRPLDQLRAEERRLSELAAAATRRAKLKEQLDEQRRRVAVLAGKVADQEAKGRAGEELKVQLAAQDEQCARLEERREQVISGWQRDVQDVAAHLRMLGREAEELKRQIEKLEAEGPDGACPTCQRPLGSEYDRVLERLQARLEEVGQDARWYSKRQDQLASEPPEVTAVKGELARAREERDRIQAQLTAAEGARAQATALNAELALEEAEARTMAGELAALPQGYEAGRHAEVRRELERLSGLEKEITQLETRLERETELKRVRAEALEEEQQIRAQITKLDADRRDLAFSEERYRAAGEAYESARAAFQAAALSVERAKGEVESARAAADAARRAEREYERVARKVEERRREYRLHNELDGVLGELRDELNSRVRPELSEIASVFLAELTDGRYNEIEIDPEYGVVVLDDGEEKPVISGGEEDVANLVLRLAISQLIAERAGQTLSLLIFDEVFGGLDDQRRESVVRLLQRLRDRFEQVILITHIESIREGMDQVLRVSYDERTGASVVRDESPGAGVEDLAVEDLAALVGEGQ